MNKLSFLATTVLLLNLLSGCAHNWKTDWSTSISQEGGSKNVQEMLLLDDGRIFFTGSEEYGKGGRVIGIFGMMDSKGHLLWSKNHDHADAKVYLNDAAVIPGGGFILAGTVVLSETNSDILVIKISNEGEILWTKRLGTDLLDASEDIVVLDDKHYLLTGQYAEDKEAKTSEAVFLTLDESGLVVNEKKFTKLALNVGKALAVAGDGNLILGLESSNDYFSIYNIRDKFYIHIIKITPAGEILWEKVLDDNQYYLKEILAEKDGTCTFLGGIRHHGFTSGSILVRKLDAQGNTLMNFSRRRDAMVLEGYAYFAGDMSLMDGGGYIVSGNVLNPTGLLMPSPVMADLNKKFASMVCKLNSEGQKIEENLVSQQQILDILAVDKDGFLVSFPGRVERISSNK